MASIRKFKEWVNPFLRRISPFLFKELLLFMKIYHFFYRGNKKKELVSLRTQMRVGIKHLYNVYSNPKRTIWTTMFVPSEILFAMGLYPFCLEIGAALFAGLGQSSNRHLFFPQISNWACVQELISPQYTSGSHYDIV